MIYVIAVFIYSADSSFDFKAIASAQSRNGF